MIENAKILENIYHSQCYLKFFITPKNEQYLRSFVLHVVKLEHDISTWKKGRALIAASSFKEQLTKEREPLFGHRNSEFKHILKPDYKLWDLGVYHIGMFIFLEPGADYRSPSREGYGAIPLIREQLIEVEEKDINLMFRR
ncbi:hypothetical protein [Bradymonas sediminis]|uniref:hypothetical protein n=1 Tax=Bradymonas sediminis TaxID=1548548 RepID=UPI00105FA5EC|nr:hypothetical protein [Bradymonas sediminis]